MKTIGFAGTAKNTGKTTAALAVIKQAHNAKLQVGLTSIGYDGENRDNVTNLPKPRYNLEIGDLIATAAECLPAGSATLEIIETTSIATDLGLVVIARVTSPGTAVIAGANREKDLAFLIQKFVELKTNLLIVDGALNRLVPMIVCDGLVLSTGAALEQDIHQIAAHAGMLVKLFSAPVLPTTDSFLENISLSYTDSTVMNFKSGSLLSTQTLNEILAKFTKPVSMLEIPGACHPVILKSLMDKNPFPDEPLHLIFGSPVKLVASGGLPLWQAISQMPNVTFSYQRTLPVNILTVNPFYPKLKPQTGLYQSAYVDKYYLLRTVRIELPNFPVYDLFQPPQPDLLRLIGVAHGEQE